MFCQLASKNPIVFLVKDEIFREATTVTKPILYLDIEGTLVLFGAGQIFLRPHAPTLLNWLERESHRLEARWLTSFSPQRVETLLQGLGQQQRDITYQPWRRCKAEVLLRQPPGFWVDDGVTSRDLEFLEENQSETPQYEIWHIPRWDGDDQDVALLELQRRVTSWLQGLEDSPASQADSEAGELVKDCDS